jgi:hypothetical protein
LTLRSLILGLLGVVFVCSYTYFNDHVMRQTMFVGNNMPISVYGLLVVYLVFFYPLIRRMNARLALRRAEIAIILAMTLTACAIPGSNLLRLFTPSLVMPHRYANTEPGWQKQEVMDLVPDGMLADVAGNEETVINGFVRGLGEANRHVRPSHVPWSAWVRPILFWMPILLSLWIALLGLAMVVHRQWVNHEHLPYPIVTFTKSLLPEEDGGRNEVFGNKLFWLGLLPVIAIHTYNYLVEWFPDYLLGKIPLGIDFSPLVKLFPTFEKGGGANLLGGEAFYTIYFTVVAVAYFLPKDVSLSLGIGPFVWCVVAGLLTSYGIGVTGWQGGWPFGVQRDGMFITGAYFATLLVLLYTGRHHFATVFRRAVGLRARDEPEGAAVWGARIFLAAMALFTAYSAIWARLDWPIALLFGLGLAALYLVMGRLIAETGLFFIVITGTPATLLWAVLGSKALGPQILLTLFMFCIVLYYDTREALMPFLVNALKLADDCRVRLGRTAALAALALLVGLAVGIPVTLYFQYDRGVDVSAWHVNQPKVPFNEVIGVIQRLDAQGQLEVAGTAAGLARFADISPHRQGVVTFAAAVLVVLVFSGLRLRFANWPLHPVMFLVWSTYAGNCFAQSFLVGWALKLGVTKYGGANIYQRLKPLMFGLIAGEMLGGMVPMIVSAVYYLSTGDQPKKFLVMPG